MRNPAALKTLVLNSDARPLSTWPLSLVSAQDAVSAIWRDRATVVETWEGAFFRSPSTTMPVPKVMMLRQFAPISGAPKFCRRSVLLRDKFRCQFCLQQLPSHELTFDHVLPRSRGGKTVWQNVVAACIPCNARKANGTKMQPATPPRRPTNAELLRAGLEFLPNDLREDYGSWLYWQVPLDR